jgi:hypothetical protein
VHTLPQLRNNLQKTYIFLFWLSCNKFSKLDRKFVHTLYSGKYRNVASNGLQVNLLLLHKVTNSPYQCPFQNYVIIFCNLTIFGQNNRRRINPCVTAYLKHVDKPCKIHTFMSPLTRALHVPISSSPPLGQSSNIYSKTEIRNIYIMSIFSALFFFAPA